MPRELNTEKLERKFTTLTKSRESIQAVSSWIMRHHEFCEEIVEHWYLALTKDQNALVMFYVANEVIQNCGKKRVPQYREAFSKVLEKAVCLEKVKEIKSDVCRILTLWKERSIFDDDFFLGLETKSVLSAVNASELISSPVVEEDEVSELEIITKYKSENLFDSLKELKAVETKTKEKEEILDYADEPQLPELNNLTGRDECIEMINKIDSFYNLAKDYLKAVNDEIKARKNALTELKYSCIFYTAQHGDVKKVANAYMTYGKRLKNIEKKLSEKMLILPSAVENNSPCFSENNTHASPIGASPFDHDTSSVSRSSYKVSPSSSNEKSLDTMFSSENLKSSTSFWSKISKKASSDFPKNFENKFEETLQKKPEQSPKQKFSKLAELFAETKSDSEKQIGPESDTLESVTGISNLKCFSSPSQQNENLSDLHIATDKQIDVPKNTDCSDEKSSNQEIKEKLDHLTKESPNEKRNTASAEDTYEIDFLLDESYDTKKAKSTPSVKRKIELLLQSKGKKICSDASKEKSFDILPSNTSAENPVIEEKSSEDVMKEDDTKLNDLCSIVSDQKEAKANKNSKISVPIITQSPIEIEKTSPNTISVTENATSSVKTDLSLEEKIQNVSNIFVPSSIALEQCKEMDFLAERSDTQDSLSNNNEFSGEYNTKNNSSIISEFNFDSESLKVLENDKFSIQTPSTFFDSSLFSSISSISTEFLKNILAKNKTSPSQNVEDNYLTNTSSVKDSTDTGKLLEVKDSEIKIKNPTFNFLESVPPTEETLEPSNIVIKPLSQNVGNENVKNEIHIKTETNIKDSVSLDNISIKSNDSEKQTTIKQEIPCFSIKAGETLLNENDKKIYSPVSDIQSKLKNQFEIEKSDEKPNLLLTLQDVLECISNKSLSLSDSKNAWDTTPLSFENCLSMYHALRSPEIKYGNGCSPSSSKNVVLSKTSSESTVTSEIYSQDNLEVMDMECDSE